MIPLNPVRGAVMDGVADRSTIAPRVRMQQQRGHVAATLPSCGGRFPVLCASQWIGSGYTSQSPAPRQMNQQRDRVIDSLSRRPQTLEL